MQGWKRKFYHPISPKTPDKATQYQLKEKRKKIEKSRI